MQTLKPWFLGDKKEWKFLSRWVRKDFLDRHQKYNIYSISSKKEREERKDKKKKKKLWKTLMKNNKIKRQSRGFQFQLSHVKCLKAIISILKIREKKKLNKQTNRIWLFLGPSGNYHLKTRIIAGTSLLEIEAAIILKWQLMNSWRLRVKKNPGRQF